MNKFKLFLIFSIGFFVNNLFCFYDDYNQSIKKNSKIVFINLTDKPVKTRILKGAEEKDYRDARNVGARNCFVENLYLDDPVKVRIGFYGLSYIDANIINIDRFKRGEQYKTLGAEFVLTSKDLQNNNVIIFINNVESQDGKENSKEVKIPSQNMSLSFAQNGVFRGILLLAPKIVGQDKFLHSKVLVNVENIMNLLKEFYKLKEELRLKVLEVKRIEERNKEKEYVEEKEKQKEISEAERKRDEELISKGEMGRWKGMLNNAWRFAKEKFGSAKNTAVKAYDYSKNLIAEKPDAEEFVRFLKMFPEDQELKNLLKRLTISLKNIYIKILKILKTFNREFSDITKNFPLETDEFNSVPTIDQFKSRDLFDEEKLGSGLFRDNIKEILALLKTINPLCIDVFGETECMHTSKAPKKTIKKKKVVRRNKRESELPKETVQIERESEALSTEKDSLTPPNIDELEITAAQEIQPNKVTGTHIDELKKKFAKKGISKPEKAPEKFIQEDKEKPDKKAKKTAQIERESEVLSAEEDDLTPPDIDDLEITAAQEIQQNKVTGTHIDELKKKFAEKGISKPEKAPEKFIQEDKEKPEKKAKKTAQIERESEALSTDKDSLTPPNIDDLEITAAQEIQPNKVTGTHVDELKKKFAEREARMQVKTTEKSGSVKEETLEGRMAGTVAEKKEKNLRKKATTSEWETENLANEPKETKQTERKTAMQKMRSEDEKIGSKKQYYAGFIKKIEVDIEDLPIDKLKTKFAELQEKLIAEKGELEIKKLKEDLRHLKNEMERREVEETKKKAKIEEKRFGELIDPLSIKHRDIPEAGTPIAIKNASNFLDRNAALDDSTSIGSLDKRDLAIVSLDLLTILQLFDKYESEVPNLGTEIQKIIEKIKNKELKAEKLLEEIQKLIKKELNKSKKK